MYDLAQAKKLIKDCLETQNPSLNLGNYGITDLTELPELFECTHLETLILSSFWWDGCVFVESNNKEGRRNHISTIPDGIVRLKKLTKFYFGGVFQDRESKEIFDISVLSHLTGLQRLDLGSNQLSDISVLSHLTGLQRLGLGSNQLSDISVLSHLTGLQSLNLWDNQLSDISP